MISDKIFLMETIIIIIAVFAGLSFIVSLAVLIWLFRLNKAENPPVLQQQLELLKSDLINKQFENLISIRDTLDKSNKTINENLSENRNTLDNRLKLFGEIENRLGELTTKTEKIEELGTNIVALSELLKPPKIRGALGEVLLENLMAEILPSQHFDRQYKFRSGQRVDAVIFLSERVLPIDSKFPLESFQRISSGSDKENLEKEFIKTVKKHIDDISGKYIRPDENSTEFAMMYIPSESIYYHFITLKNGEGFDYALKKRVIPTSPGHIYGFLISLLSVVKDIGFNQTRSELSLVLRNITESINNINTYFKKIEGSIRSLSNNSEKAQKETNVILKNINKLNEVEAE